MTKSGAYYSKKRFMKKAPRTHPLLKKDASYIVKTSITKFIKENEDMDNIRLSKEALCEISKISKEFLENLLRKGKQITELRKGKTLSGKDISSAYEQI